MDSKFKERVEAMVAQIPKGRVMTYGQLAALCGNARASRIVGGIAHFGATYQHTTPDCPFAKQTVPQGFLAQDFVEASGSTSTYQPYASVESSTSPRPASKCAGCGGERMPWQRVVNKKGGLASGYPGGREGHKAHLEQEGLKIEGNHVEVEKLIWSPKS